MLIGPRDGMLAEAERRAQLMKGFLYGKDENGGTSTFYVSPVPFDRIDATIQKGPGRPHMRPGVKRRMAGTDGLGKAVLAAPAVGIVAGAVTWLADRKARVEKEGKKDV